MVVLAAVMIWIYLFGGSDRQGDGRVYVDQLREEFEKISPPPGVSALEDLSASAKREAALVGREYATQPPIEQVLRSYQQQLSSNGWKYSGRFQGTSSWWHERYCKGEFGASVEVRPTGETFIYFFSMAWNSATVSECSAKNQDD